MVCLRTHPLGDFLSHSLLGFPLTFSVFQRYYLAEASFERSAFFPVVGSLEIVSFPLHHLSSFLIHEILTTYCDVWVYQSYVHLSWLQSSYATTNRGNT
jgi:hypothetical protein